MKSKKIKYLTIFIIQVMSLCLLVSVAHAEKKWDFSAELSSTNGQYVGPVIKQNILTNGLMLTANYTRKIGLAFVYNNSVIQFKGYDDFEQDTVAGHAQYQFFSDTFNGYIIPQLTLQSLSYSGLSTSSEDVNVIAPKIAYLSAWEMFYVDLEYVTSTYPSIYGLKVWQWTPSVSFTWNKHRDWVSIKAYIIKTDNINYSLRKKQLNSVSINWSHWTGYGRYFRPNSVFLKVLAGRRVFAVDNDSFSVYNLPDIQTGSLFFGANWNLLNGIDISAVLGSEKYENQWFDIKYRQDLLFVSVVKHW